MPLCCPTIRIVWIVDVHLTVFLLLNPGLGAVCSMADVGPLSVCVGACIIEVGEMDYEQ